MAGSRRAHEGASPDDVRRIALSLPGATGDSEGSYRVGGKLFAWTWLERVDPKRRRVPNRDVLVVRLQSERDREILVEVDPAVFFTEPHYDGYPAVLVRLAAIDLELLRTMLIDAWRSRAPRRLLDQLPEP